MPDKTRETIESDGWIHTGDVGVFLPDGKLKIIDRKKNIFKLSIGEYVAPEKVEQIYNKVPFVLQSFVYGDSFKAGVVGVVVPDEEVVLPFCRKTGVPGDRLSEVCKSEKLKKVILKAMWEEGKKSKLLSFEQVKDIYLSDTPFSIENDLVTPTFKVKRQNAQKAFQSQINHMYLKLD